MKIMIIANTYWYIFKFRLNLIDALREKSYSVVACAASDEKYSKKITCNTRSIFIDKNGLNPLKEINTILSIFRVIKNEKPDLILTYTPKINIYTGVCAQIIGIPYIVNISGVGNSFSRSTVLKQITTIAYKISLKNASHVYFQNVENMQYFIKYNLINNYYSRIFGSGIDLEHFKPTNIIGERGKTIFLFAGRLIKEKGILDFISAATILKKNGSTSNFVVCGNCEDKNIEEKIIIAKKCRIIEYFGLVDDMKEIIDSVDCVVLPTYYNEGLPRILIEAIAMGRIIITCKQSWTEDILYNNSNGYIAKIKDPDDLAMAMKKVEKLSKEEMQKMGKISINIAKKYFDERNIIESYLSNIDLIKQRKTKK